MNSSKLLLLLFASVVALLVFIPNPVLSQEESEQASNNNKNETEVIEIPSNDDIITTTTTSTTSTTTPAPVVNDSSSSTDAEPSILEKPLVSTPAPPTSPFPMLIGIVSYNSPCNITSDCEPNRNLECINEICTCSDSTQVYDIRQGSCVIPIGRKCDDTSPNGDMDSKCPEFAECYKAQCICKTGYSMHTLTRCKLDTVEETRRKPIVLYPLGNGNGKQIILSDCEPQCDESKGLFCQGGKCKCGDPEAIFMEEFGSCLNKTMQASLKDALELVSTAEKEIKGFASILGSVEGSQKKDQEFAGSDYINQLIGLFQEGDSGVTEASTASQVASPSNDDLSFADAGTRATGRPPGDVSTSSSQRAPSSSTESIHGSDETLASSEHGDHEKGEIGIRPGSSWLDFNQPQTQAGAIVQRQAPPYPGQEHQQSGLFHGEGIPLDGIGVIPGGQNHFRIPIQGGGQYGGGGGYGPGFAGGQGGGLGAGGFGAPGGGIGGYGHGLGSLGGQGSGYGPGFSNGGGFQPSHGFGQGGGLGLGGGYGAPQGGQGGFGGPQGGHHGGFGAPQGGYGGLFGGLQGGQGGFGAPQGGQGGFGAPQGGQVGFGAPPQGGQGGFGAPPPQGGQGGYGAPQGGHHGGLGAPQGGHHGGLGAPQGGQGGYGAPPQGGQGGFGAPPQGGQGGFGGPPGGQGGLFGGPGGPPPPGPARGRHDESPLIDVAEIVGRSIKLFERFLPLIHAVNDGLNHVFKKPPPLHKREDAGGEEDANQRDRRRFGEEEESSKESEGEEGGILSNFLRFITILLRLKKKTLAPGETDSPLSKILGVHQM